MFLRCICFSDAGIFLDLCQKSITVIFDQSLYTQHRGLPYHIFYKMWSVDTNLFDCLVHINFKVDPHSLEKQTTGTEQTTLACTIPEISNIKQSTHKL